MDGFEAARHFRDHNPEMFEVRKGGPSEASLAVSGHAWQCFLLMSRGHSGYLSMHLIVSRHLEDGDLRFAHANQLVPSEGQK